MHKKGLIKLTIQAVVRGDYILILLAFQQIQQINTLYKGGTRMELQGAKLEIFYKINFENYFN